jgi:FAD/FMN-containing dehydrogenase
LGDRIQHVLHHLRARLPGLVSTPGDARYGEATTIWPKPVGRTPRIVVHCRTAEDVQAAVRVARDGGVALSVRGGGHDWAGRSLCDGVVVDLSGMRGVTAFHENGTARMAGGARAADVCDVADRMGLAAVTGSVGSVGMAGLTLGGGYGSLIGRFGLALDNLLEAQVVLADGRIVVANPDNEAALFWALRGGGGNFGVVTEMHHRLHHLPGVRSGLLIYPFAEASCVLKGFVDIVASAPEEMTAQIGFIAGPDGAPVVMIVPTWCGRPEQGEAHLAPFLRLGTLLVNTVDVISYRASLTMFDPYLVNGRRTFMETCWLPRFDGTSVDICIEAMAAAVSPGCAILTHEFRGAAARVPEDATAFGLRREHVLIEILAACDGPNPLEEKPHELWARTTLQAFDAMALPGGYPNLLAGGHAERAAKSYGGNAERLMQVKRRYDPDNVFASAIPLPG